MGGTIEASKGKAIRIRVKKTRGARMRRFWKGEARGRAAG